MVKESRSCIAENETQSTPDPADDQALQHKDALNLRPPGAHGHENGDITPFFENEHHQHNQNVESSHDLDEADGQQTHDPFKTQSVEERSVLIHPGAGDQFRPGNGFCLNSDSTGFEDIVQAELDGIDYIV